MVDMPAIKEIHVRAQELERQIFSFNDMFPEIELLPPRGKRLVGVIQIKLQQARQDNFIMTARSFLSDILGEAASRKDITVLMVLELFRRSKYALDQDKVEYARDVFSLLEETTQVCALGVYRGLRECGLSEAFVPPARKLVGYIHDQQSRLLGLVEALQRLEESIKRIDWISPADGKCGDR